jgi:hypothetical protein
MQKTRTLDPDFERRLDEETARLMAERLASRRPGTFLKAGIALIAALAAGFCAWQLSNRAPGPIGGEAALTAFRQEFGAVQQAVVSAYSEDYSKIDARALVGVDLLPARLLHGGGFRHNFGGTIRVFPLKGGGYGMSADFVPGWACSELVYLHPGGFPDDVTVISSEGTSKASGRPMTPSEAVTGCGSARGFTTIEWDFE